MNQHLEEHQEAASAHTEILELRGQVRELAGDQAAALQYLAAIRDQLNDLFASRRWRIGSRLIDAWLLVRGKRRPATAEDRLRDIFRDVDAWERRRRSPSSRHPKATTPQHARTETERQQLLFYRLLDEVSRRAGERSFELALRAGDELLQNAPRATSAPGPLVSVVLPTYDRAHVLDEAIRSVREQSHANWELLVSDDGSADRTEDLVRGFDDSRIRYLRHENAGAAVARNRALREARGELIAYLDSDNVWHPDHLATMVGALEQNPGQTCAFAKHVDVVMAEEGYRLKGYRSKPFDYEALREKNFIDLNVFVHRRELFEVLGGFDERLRRQQDWDLILRYTFLRDPLFVDAFLALYRRNPAWDQITVREHSNPATVRLIARKQVELHESGPTLTFRTPRPSVSVLSWDICRNHFSKAYNIAEALAQDREVELVGFRFFEDEIFPPYSGETPAFETRYLPGGGFPDFHRELARALASLRGDVIYAVKPRLPSLGLALLANFHFGKPIVLEINDLESAAAAPSAGATKPRLSLDGFDPTDARLLDPAHETWTRLLEGLAPDLPAVVTHNANLDRLFGNKSHQLRNIKDEAFYDPTRWSREEVRSRLGFSPEDRVILFGGMVRRHKGIFPLVDFIEARGGGRYKLLVASSRPTPDEVELKKMAGHRVIVLPPSGRNLMAEINLAADAAVLWLDPQVPASHYQMPFKLTDALAMELPVVANPISDLTHLGQLGIVHLVDYGDFDQLERTLNGIFADRNSTRQMTRRGRRLYLRQFSYQAARANLEVLLRQQAGRTECLPAARSFEAFFSEFYQATRSPSSVAAPTP